MSMEGRYHAKTVTNENLCCTDMGIWYFGSVKGIDN